MTKTGEETYFKLSPNVYLGRWRMCLELFGRVFLDDVGSEPCSVLNELGKFDVKEAKFRREMEKLRNSHQKDLYLEMVRMGFCFFCFCCLFFCLPCRSRFYCSKEIEFHSYVLPLTFCLINFINILTRSIHAPS